VACCAWRSTPASMPKTVRRSADAISRSVSNEDSGVTLHVALGACWLLVAGCQQPDDGVAVHTLTESGSLLRWRKPSVVLTLSPERAGTTVDVVLRSALRNAVSSWNRELSDCGAPRLVVAESSLKRAFIREDRINEVLMHDRAWCPPDAADFGHCYDRQLHASTRLRPERRPGHPTDGLIKEADLEVNGVDFAWSALGERPGTLNLEAMLVHELGHVLGLDHPCAPLVARRADLAD
jgi:hypothetical protein